MSEQVNTHGTKPWGLTRKKPMVRTAFKRGAGAGLKSTSTLTRSPIKKHAPKKRPWHDKAMLDACRGQVGVRCWLAVPGICGNDVRTVVPCHSNFSEHGKGGARKADDEFTVPGCGACHYWLDFGPASYEIKKARFFEALARWAPYRDGQTSEVFPC